MRITPILCNTTSIYIVLLAVFCIAVGAAPAMASDADAQVRIAALHRQDIAATLHSDPHELADREYSTRSFKSVKAMPRPSFTRAFCVR
jgi:hypothetical protein